MYVGDIFVLPDFLINSVGFGVSRREKSIPHVSAAMSYWSQFFLALFQSKAVARRGASYAGSRLRDN